MTPRPLLHLEGTAVLIASLIAYRSIHAGYGLKYPTQFKDTHLNPSRHAFAFFTANTRPVHTPSSEQIL